MGSKFFSLVLAMVLALSLFGCGQKAAPVETAPVTEAATEAATEAPTQAATEAPTEPETEPTTEATQPPEPWRENVLRADPVWSGGVYPPFVFGSDVKREKVSSITFLDTLAEMPEDAWDVSEAQDGRVMAWLVPNGENPKLFDLFIAGEGGVRAPAHCEEMFANYQNAAYIHFGDSFHVTSETVDIHAFFTGCTMLEEIDNLDFDVSNCTDISSMFEFTRVKELNLSGWDTSKNTNLYGMFGGNKVLEKVDISGWDTSNVDCTVFMFKECQSLRELNMDGFDTSNVLYMHQMFYNCKSLENVDVSGWDTSKVEDMREMFRGCRALGDLDAGVWEIDSVTQYQSFMDWDKTINGEPWMDMFQK